MTSRTKRILLSALALVLAAIIAFLQDGSPPQDAAPPTEQVETANNREQAVAQAIRWLESQEGGKHRGHAIARHVGKSDAQLRQRLQEQSISAASAFYDLEMAAVAVVRTIHYKANDAKVRQWLGDDASQRRLALRRAFDRPIGRIVFRSGDARDGKSAVAVLTKWREDGEVGYRLLTAYVER